MSEERSLAVIGDTSYRALQIDVEQALEAMAANLGGSITQQDLMRVKSPSQGATAFSIPSLKGKDQMVEELKGVIVLQSMGRIYYAKSMQDGGAPGMPPDCASGDNVMGFGTRVLPNGKLANQGDVPNSAFPCEDCVLSKFSDNTRPPCKQYRFFYMLRPGDTIPVVLQIPPANLKAARDYLMLLMQNGLPTYAVETTVTLNKQTSRGGQVYSGYEFAVSEELEAEQVDKMRGYHKAIMNQLVRVTAPRAARPATSEDDLVDIE
jgi:hypothetical protein